MSNLFKTLQSPHPFTFNVGSVLIPGFIAFVIMLVFAPFGFSVLEFANRAILSIMFGLISSFGVLMVIGLLKWLAPQFMNEERWTTGKEFILILTVVAGICLLNFGVILLLGMSDTPSLNLFKLVVLYTVGISIIPVGTLILFEQYSHQKKKLRQAKKLTEQLRKRTQENNTETESTLIKPIIFEAENGKPELQLKPEEVLFLKSDGNYIEVYYRDENENTQKKLIRNRLKNYAPILPSELFFRCHKSFIVNSRYIIQVEGNARNLELIIRGVDLRIPVSRSKSDQLSDFIKSE